MRRYRAKVDIACGRVEAHPLRVCRIANPRTSCRYSISTVPTQLRTTRGRFCRSVPRTSSSTNRETRGIAHRAATAINLHRSLVQPGALGALRGLCATRVLRRASNSIYPDSACVFKPVPVLPVHTSDDYCITRSPSEYA